MRRPASQTELDARLKEVSQLLALHHVTSPSVARGYFLGGSDAYYALVDHLSSDRRNLVLQFPPLVPVGGQFPCPYPGWRDPRPWHSSQPCELHRRPHYVALSSNLPWRAPVASRTICLSNSPNKCLARPSDGTIAQEFSPIRPHDSSTFVPTPSELVRVKEILGPCVFGYQDKKPKGSDEYKYIRLL